MAKVLLSLDDTLHQLLRVASANRGEPQYRIIQEALRGHLTTANEAIPESVAKPLRKLLKTGHEDAVLKVLDRLVAKYDL